MIINGTSTQLGYTVPFMLVLTGKYRTDDKLKSQGLNLQTIRKLNTTQKKQTTQNQFSSDEKKDFSKHSKTKLLRFSRLLRHSASKRGGGLFYNAPQPTLGVSISE